MESVQRTRERAHRQLGLVRQFRKRKNWRVAGKPDSDDSDSDWTPQMESQIRKRSKPTTMSLRRELADEFGEFDEECDSNSGEESKRGSN